MGSFNVTNESTERISGVIRTEHAQDTHVSRPRYARITPEIRSDYSLPKIGILVL